MTMTAIEAEQWLCARLDEAGGKALEISRDEFASLLLTAPHLIEYRPTIPGAGIHAGYSPTFSGAPVVLAR